MCMKTKIIASLFLCAACLVASFDLNAQEKKSQQAPKFHKKFIEHFNKPASEYFNQNGGARRTSTQMRYIPATSSFVEKDTKVMMLRFDPTDPAGAGRGGDPVRCERGGGAGGTAAWVCPLVDLPQLVFRHRTGRTGGAGFPSG